MNNPNKNGSSQGSLEGYQDGDMVYQNLVLEDGEESNDMMYDGDDNYMEELEEYTEDEEYIELPNGQLVAAHNTVLSSQPVSHNIVGLPRMSSTQGLPLRNPTGYQQRQPARTPQPQREFNQVFTLRGNQMVRLDKPNSQMQSHGTIMTPSANTVLKYVPPENSFRPQAIRVLPSESSVFIPSSNSALKPVSHSSQQQSSTTYSQYRKDMLAMAVKNGLTTTTASRPAKKRSTLPGQRKPCNCTKSMCLKLYCDCFANGEFCKDCNCKDCHNSLEHNADRSRAIKQSLERNPNAFKPKIDITGTQKPGKVDGERHHQKGCHCKKSGCLKNYCECYEAKVPCTERCKCKGCQNTEHDRASRYKDRGPQALVNLAGQSNATSSALDNRSESPLSEDEESETENPEQPDPRTHPWFYMTDEVIEAASLCMVAQADEVMNTSVVSQDKTVEEMERMVLREFGRCLKQIIQSASTPPVVEQTEQPS